jgi:hypothetical protein
MSIYKDKSTKTLLRLLETMKRDSLWLTVDGFHSIAEQNDLLIESILEELRSRNVEAA